ncbi:hypothetical protein V6N12_040348 [Hibiscus sabdariffa]|uniref:Uncharacterized protein n=1 Tax=Hibiscus sabdariffa TaxID=183260 RepID=A0ABR2E4T7_9ROSI
MITRSNLAEQLREYQIRSKNDWASVSIFTSTSNLTSSRVDVVLFVIWELVILAFLTINGFEEHCPQQIWKKSLTVEPTNEKQGNMCLPRDYMIGKQGDSTKDMRQDMNHCLPKQF